ncbi:MAG: hypothetical protein FGM52_14915 [Mycobacterium sp.]|nr:hypothetical protein [Mycobacterium sp.]
MSSDHASLGPELRQLAQAILERLDPAVRAAAAAAADSLRGPGRCQQVWCPVCALAALINGEQHPLLGVIAEHSLTLLAVIQKMTASAATDAAQPPTGAAAGPQAEPPPTSNGRYHRIEIVIENSQDADA